MEGPHSRFEIRVALIGYVSVGKTTVLNALFGAKYGEVAMKRTTAVVNSFRTWTRSEQQESENGIEHKTASATLAESMSDNALHRKANAVVEKTFDILLDEPLHPMRKDTNLVIVDIPGINEAGTSSKYRDYVNDHWHTFDIAVVVMDGRQGVNTDEQVDLIKLVKKNVENIKDIPVILLLNKIDDPQDSDQKVLIEELCTTVAKLFQEVTPAKPTPPQVPSQPAAGLFGMPPMSGNGEHGGSTSFGQATSDNSSDNSSAESGGDFTIGVTRQPRKNVPLASSFVGTALYIQLSRSLYAVPVSAMHAFLYLSGAKLSFESFCKLDNEFLDKLGKDSYGRQWHRYTPEEKLKMAFDAVSNEEQRRDGVKISNFHEFLRLLKQCIGDETGQKAILGKQVQVLSRRLRYPSIGCDIGAEFGQLCDRAAAIGSNKEQVTQSFWIGFKRMRDRTFTSFEKAYDTHQPASGPEVLAILPLVLRSYLKEVVRHAVSRDEMLDKMTMTMETTKQMVWRYGTFLHQSRWTVQDMMRQNAVIGSILLVSHDPTFCRFFGALKIALEFCSGKVCHPSNMFAPNFSCPKCSRKGFVVPGRPRICQGCNITWATQDMQSGGHCPECFDGTLVMTQKHCCRLCAPATTCSHGWEHRKVLYCLECELCNKTWFVQFRGDKMEVASSPTLNSGFFEKNLNDPKHYGNFVKECCSLLHDILQYTTAEASR